MVKLQKNGKTGSYWLVVPTSIVQSKGWKKHDEFVIGDLRNGIKFVRGQQR